MGKEGWTNLSVHTTEYDRVRRLFDTELKTDKPWATWLMETLTYSLERTKFLRQNYPHLRFIGNTQSGCVIEDMKAKKIITIKFDGKKMISDGGDESHVIFASMNPNLTLKASA